MSERGEFVAKVVVVCRPLSRNNYYTDQKTETFVIDFSRQFLLRANAILEAKNNIKT